MGAVADASIELGEESLDGSVGQLELGPTLELDLLSDELVKGRVLLAGRHGKEHMAQRFLGIWYQSLEDSSFCQIVCKDVLH